MTTPQGPPEPCLQPQLNATLRARGGERTLTWLLPSTDGQRASCPRPRERPGCYVSAQRQITLRTARTYSVGTALRRQSTACVPTLTQPPGKEEEQGTTPAESSQESQDQPSFSYLCCYEKNQTNKTQQTTKTPNKTTAQGDLAQT